MLAEDKQLVRDMYEIYKVILERISHTGDMLESDILFCKLYKAKVEPLLYTIIKGD